MRAQRTSIRPLSGDRESHEKQSVFQVRHGHSWLNLTSLRPLRFHDMRSKIDEARECVRNRWDELFTYRELKRGDPGLPSRTNGPGATERSMGTVVGHRPQARAPAERTPRA